MAPKKSAASKRKTASPKSATRARAATGTKVTSPAKQGLKTQPTSTPIAPFLAKLDDATREACAQLDAWMQKATGSPGVMYGTAIAGYGSSTVRYADGREMPWMKLGFSPRKNALTLYGVLSAAPAGLLEKLGKYSTGKGCLYIKRFSDVDTKVLERLIATAARA